MAAKRHAIKIQHQVKGGDFVECKSDEDCMRGDFRREHRFVCTCGAVGPATEIGILLHRVEILENQLGITFVWPLSM